MRSRVLSVAWSLAVLGFFALMLALGRVSAEPGLVGLLALSFLLELVDSSLGMGFGTSLTPVLLLLGYAPLDLVPTILVSEFLSGFAASLFHNEAGNVNLRGGRHLKTAILLSVFSLLGVTIGVETAFRIPRSLLTTLIGVIIVGSGAMILLLPGRGFAFRRWKIALLGLVASFNKALSGGGYGPLMTSGQVLSGIEARAAVGITSFAEGFTCLAGSLLFLAKGQTLDPGLLLPVLTGSLLSVPVSARVVRRLGEERMKRAIAAFTVGLGAFVLLKKLL